ncbi:MAG: APC family permease [Candidatus Thermoplasmatota archaeon]|nr:APC family permease [Candidatus Thermoplasmatota archaeon]MCL6003171.1 APC family permease [Candidatus Thermoplasmatota archaeon]
MRKGAVGQWHAVFQAYTHVAPAGDIGILLTGVALFALGASPLAVLLAWVLYLLMVNTNYRFSKRVIHAGGYYAIGGHGFGGYYGFMNGWTYLMNEMIIYPSFGLLGFTSVVYLLTPAITGITYIWILIIMVPFTTGLLFNYFGIRPSLIYLLITAGAEVIFLISTSWFIIFHMGSANTLSVFSLAGVKGDYVAFFFAMLYGIEAYGGMGTVIGIGEEVKDAKKSVPRAILIASILVVATLVSAMYALTIAWGPASMASYGLSPDPGLIIWHRFFGLPGELILLFFVLNGYLAYTVANPIVQSRVLYSMARDGVLPKWLAVTHKKYHTPYRAIVVVSVVALVTAIAFSIPYGPFVAAIITGGVSGIGLVLAHAMSNIAYINFARKAKIKFNVLLDGIVPFISTATLLPIIYFGFKANVGWPYYWVAIIAGVWIVGFALYGLWLYKNKREDLEKAGVGDYDEVKIVDDTQGGKPEPITPTTK